MHFVHVIIREIIMSRMHSIIFDTSQVALLGRYTEPCVPLYGLIDREEGAFANMMRRIRQ